MNNCFTPNFANNTCTPYGGNTGWNTPFYGGFQGNYGWNGPTTDGFQGNYGWNGPTTGGFQGNYGWNGPSYWNQNQTCSTPSWSNGPAPATQQYNGTCEPTPMWDTNAA